MSAEALQFLPMEDETLEDLQLHGLRLLQKKTGFRYGTDSVLLSDFAHPYPSGLYFDFGTGSGVLPLLLYGKGKCRAAEAIEIQPRMADMSRRSFQMNGLQEALRVTCMDVRDLRQHFAPNLADGVICNPPYGVKRDEQALSRLPEERLARFQDADGLSGWMKAAYYILRGKGRLSVVYPASGMPEMISLMKNAGLEPKRLRLVFQTAEKEASLALLEAVKDAKPGLQVLPPLLLQTRDGKATPEVRRIYGLEEFQ